MCLIFVINHGPPGVLQGFWLAGCMLLFTLAYISVKKGLFLLKKYIVHLLGIYRVKLKNEPTFTALRNKKILVLLYILGQYVNIIE